MKKLVFALFLSLMCVMANATTQVTTSNGKDFVATSTTEKSASSNGAKTGYTITIKDVKYDVYKGAKGGLYIIKNGKKVYSFAGKEEIKKAMGL